jgi:NTE family protein
MATKTSKSRQPTTKPAAPKVVRNAVDQTPAALAGQYQTVALVLQGGGALGAYQCGVYEALHEADIRPNWFVGTSIGAINAAILAGNAPEHRVERLHEFWDLICEPIGGASAVGSGVRALLSFFPTSDVMGAWANSLGALGALFFGQEGFFKLRQFPPFAFSDGSPAATSFYDTSALKGTLERFVDFDRINAPDGARLSVGAVCVENANVRYFDSAHEAICAEHIMASGALPPGFPSVEVDGKHFWDGGLVSNTPLERVWAEAPLHDTLALQVDLWSARGDVPHTMMDVLERRKDIQYSSRTRRGTDTEAQFERLRHAISELVSKVPEGALDARLKETLKPWMSRSVFNVVHLIYQAKSHEAQYKDFAFGIGTQHEHWDSGFADMAQTLEHPKFFEKPPRDVGVATHDVHRIAAARRRHGAKT